MLLVNHPDIVLVQGPGVLPNHTFTVLLEILIPHIMLSESKDAADAHILGCHLGNMLIIHITITNDFLCKKNTFPDFCITQIGAFPYWDFLGLLVWWSGDLIETYCGKKNAVAICSK